jgi:hypothetical protein
VVILVIFAAFASIDFGRSLVALLWMSTILSAVIGAVRREPPFDTVLNHWDETAAYAALCALSGYPRDLATLCGSYEIAALSPSNSYPGGKILAA